MRYHLSDILSVSTGCLLSTRHMDGVYDILGFMFGRSLFTHEIPDVIDKCKPSLVRQLPFLNSIRSDDITRDNAEEWLQEQIATYGEWYDIHPLP